MVSFEELKKRAEIYKNSKGMIFKNGFEYNPNYEDNMYFNVEKTPKTTRSKTIEKKARSDIKKEDGKYKVDTDMKVRAGLNKKEKNALAKSINTAVKQQILGSGLKGSKKDYDEFKKVLIEHIGDIKEPKDNKDYKQSKQIIGRMKGIKRDIQLDSDDDE